MREMEFHDKFEPTECEAGEANSKAGLPAVTLGAGLTWMDVYAAATDRDLVRLSRHEIQLRTELKVAHFVYFWLIHQLILVYGIIFQYVQGGGGTSVGVVGWLIGGGYGTFSKMFGSGPANLLEARVVIASGEVVTASECKNQDLFFALRGGGHGFGVVASLTVRTHPLPSDMGHIGGHVQARSEESFLKFVEQLLEFYQTTLSGPNFGEAIFILPNANLATLSMETVHLSFEEMVDKLAPMTSWLEDHQDEFDYEIVPSSYPGYCLWSLECHTPGKILSPYNPGEPDRTFFWSASVPEISAYWLALISRFLRTDQHFNDVNAAAKRLINIGKVAPAGGIFIQSNKGQYGASQWAVDELENTAMHPSVKDSFGLMITGYFVSHYSPRVPSYLQYNTSSILDVMGVCNSTDLAQCDTSVFDEALGRFREETPGAGAYFSEGDYFEPDWQENFWGTENYDRLLSIKTTWDLEGLFYCHNCVGSEFWEEGGFCTANYVNM